MIVLELIYLFFIFWNDNFQIQKYVLESKINFEIRRKVSKSRNTFRNNNFKILKIKFWNGYSIIYFQISQFLTKHIFHKPFFILYFMI